MPFAAALSEHPLPTHAIGEAVGQVLERLGEEPDAVVVFVSGGFVGAIEDLAATVRATSVPGSTDLSVGKSIVVFDVATGALVGATASGVLGGEREVEHGAAVSLLAIRADSDGPPATTVRLGAARRGETWEIATDVDLAGAVGTLVLLADPATFPVEPFLDDLASRSPQLQVVGGLASSASGARACRRSAWARVACGK